MEREGRICGRETREEVTLPSLNGAFGCIAAVLMGGDSLKINIKILKSLF